jgi:hypothetical protein
MRKIILIFLLTIFFTSSFVLGDSKQSIDVSQYNQMYQNGQYQEIINRLQYYLIFPKRENSSPIEWVGPELNLSDSDFSHFLFIIADSYRMLQKYTKSMLLYADIINYSFGTEYENTAKYSFTLYKKIGIIKEWSPEPPKNDEFTRYTFGVNPQHESIFEAILSKLSDHTSLSEKRQFFKSLASNDNNNDWVTELSKFCAGESSIDKVIAITPAENIGIENIYTGYYFEISGDQSLARSLYQKALAQIPSKNIELLLLRNKLGLFTLKIIYTKYGVTGKEVVNLTDVYSIKASSAKCEDKLYSIQNLIDDNPQTAWVPDSKTSGIGEWTEISFDDPVQINSLTLTNGYAKSEEVFKNNNRIKDATLVFSDGSKQPVLLKDTMEPQKINVNRKSRTVRLIIDSVYKGIKFDDTCLSGIDVDFRSQTK